MLRQLWHDLKCCSVIRCSIKLASVLRLSCDPVSLALNRRPFFDVAFSSSPSPWASLSASSSFFSSLSRLNLDTLAGLSTPCAKSKSTCVEHSPHMTAPQSRQWCFLLLIPNDLAQDGHSLTSSSSTHGTTDCSWERRRDGSEGRSRRRRSRRTRTCRDVKIDYYMRHGDVSVTNLRTYC